MIDVVAQLLLSTADNNPTLARAQAAAAEWGRRAVRLASRIRQQPWQIRYAGDDVRMLYAAELCNALLS